MHPLHQKLRQLRIRLRQLLLLHGLSATVAAVLLTMLVLGAADYAFRLRDPGVRVLSSLGLLAVAVRVYAIMVIVRVLFSWLPPQSRRNEVYLFLFSATEPLLGPLRRALPPAGGFD